MAISTRRRSRSFRVCAAAVCLGALGYAGAAMAQTASPAAFSMGEFKAALVARIAFTGARDTMPVRVPNGQSCVEASADRAHEIAVVVRSFRQDGKFADYGARVGSVSGWNAGFGSIHTYSVVEIYDATGHTLYTVDADNYVGPIIVSNHGKVDWNATNVKLVEDIKPVVVINAFIEGPRELKPGEMVSMKAVLKDPPAYVNYPLSYEWREAGSEDVRQTTASVAFFAPPAGNYSYNVTILYKDSDTRQMVKLARVNHELKVSGLDWSGAWDATDSRGRFNGQFDLKVTDTAVSGVFVCGAGRLPVSGSLEGDRMSLLITFGNPEVINYFFKDMALSTAIGSISAKVVLGVNPQSPNNLRGLLYPFNVEYHADATTGAIVVTQRYSGGRVDPRNPERDFSLARK